MTQLPSLLGAVRYEFLMQIRRRALWIAMLAVCPFLFRHFDAFYLSNQLTLQMSLGQWTQLTTRLFPIAAGLVLADRYARDRKSYVDELITTTPVSNGTRLFGKWLGSGFATLTPIFLVHLAGLLLILNHWHAWNALPEALALFVVVDGVAVLFVCAFSIACTTVLWTVLYQVLFVGYWFWGNLLRPNLGIPTLNGTLLTPSGHFTLPGLFPSTVLRQGSYTGHTVTAGEGLASLALLLACALAAQLGAWAWLDWRQAHR